jgi:long-chain acyl-CoA synthetase
VVGLPDRKYGEIVTAFIEPRHRVERPSLQEVQEFVRKKLARHKAPIHVFWLEPGEEFPKTGSGKIQKHILRRMGLERVENVRVSAKL